MAGNSKQPGRSVISKISSILLAVSREGSQTLTELATALHLPLSTVHRLANELVDWQVLERESDGTFRMGTPFRSAVCQHNPGAVPDGVRARAVPVLEDLFRLTGMPVRLGHVEDGQVAYIEKVSVSRPVSRHLPAARLPAHATAMGKVLLAYLSAPEAEAIIAAGLTRFTPFTVTDPARLRAALRSVRGGRMALCDRELEPTWTAVAVPVFGAGGCIVAAIEARVRDLGGDLSSTRCALVVGAGCLSRELARACLDPSAEAHLAGPRTTAMSAERPAVQHRRRLVALDPNTDVRYGAIPLS